MVPEDDHDRIVVLETQVARLISDNNSEKGTRSRSNDRIDGQFEKMDLRLRGVERNMNYALGAFTVLNVVFTVGVKLLWK